VPKVELDALGLWMVLMNAAIIMAGIDLCTIVAIKHAVISHQISMKLRTTLPCFNDILKMIVIQCLVLLMLSTIKLSGLTTAPPY